MKNTKKNENQAQFHQPSQNDMMWILGPCSVESEALYIETGKELAKIMNGKNWYYKASFDKANRSSVLGNRGPGLEESIKLFSKIKKIVPGIKLTTDFHEPYQAKKLAPYIDCIQIPAFLCRQTDLLVEAGKYFDVVNIKKGQWLHPENIIHSVSKIKDLNKKAKVWLTERGTSFGYNQLIIDFASVPLFHKHFDRVILDCTHSTQYVKDGFNLGNRDLAERYLLSAPIFGYNGVFAETHPNPGKAISDGTCQLYLSRIRNLVTTFDRLSGELNEEFRVVSSAVKEPMKKEKPKFGCFITVRTSSRRLPNKTLLPIRNKRVIEHVIDRVKLIKGVDVVVLCTSTDMSDDILETIARQTGIQCFRGSLNDKLVRWLGAIEKFNVDYFVNFNAIDIFCDPKLADSAIAQMRKKPCDLLTVPPTLICGASPMCISSEAIRKISQVKDTENTEDWDYFFTKSGLPFDIRTLKVSNRIFHNFKISDSNY